MARSPRAALALAVAVAALAVAARPAHAATDCVGALLKANIACGAELAAVRDGKAPAAVKPACCAEAAAVFSPSFGADCACGPALAPYRGLLDRSQAAIADKCASSDIFPLPACGADGGPAPAAAALADAAAAAAEIPPWGTGSVCTSQDAPPTQGACSTKCTPRRAGASPTDAQVATAEACGTTRGVCAGLGVGAPPAATGTTFCNKGVPVADPSPRNGVSRECFKCCVVRLAPTGNARRGKNACRNPDANSGGGGGNGGGGGGCFPGSATVVVEGRGTTPLRDLRLGDRVLTAKAGAEGEAVSAYETVYFFGHRLPQASSEFVRLELLEGGAAAAAPALELTRKHLVPVLAEAAGANEPLSLASAVYTRAQDVRAGDRLLLVGGGGGGAGGDAPLRAGVVASVSSVARSDGLYAPLTTGGGHVAVNGVLASVHSNNMLDPLAEFLGRRDLLQWAYETFGASVLKTVYDVIGADSMAKLNPLLAGLGLTDAAQLAAGARGFAATAGAARKSA